MRYAEHYLRRLSSCRACAIIRWICCGQNWGRCLIWSCRWWSVLTKVRSMIYRGKILSADPPRVGRRTPIWELFNIDGFRFWSGTHALMASAIAAPLATLDNYKFSVLSSALFIWMVKGFCWSFSAVGWDQCNCSEWLSRRPIVVLARPSRKAWIYLRSQLSLFKGGAEFLYTYIQQIINLKLTILTRSLLAR